MEIRPVSPVDQTSIHIAATARHLTIVTPDRIKSPVELEAIAERRAKEVGKRRRKNKTARASRRRNR
jgi:hypothetical protein